MVRLADLPDSTIADYMYGNQIWSSLDGQLT